MNKTNVRAESARRNRENMICADVQCAEVQQSAADANPSVPRNTELTTSRSDRRGGWSRSRRRQHYLRGASCVRCGSTKHLDADHIDPTTKVTSDFWNWPEEEFQVEWAKCQWLCRKCHLLKTADDRRRLQGVTRTPKMRAAFAWLKRHGFMAAAGEMPLRKRTKTAEEENREMREFLGKNAPALLALFEKGNR